MLIPNFSQRSTQPEMMDTANVSYAEFNHCLTDLETLNRWTGAYPPTLNWLNSLWADVGPGPFTVWDVGSGGGDMLRRIWQAYPYDRQQLTLVGFDLNPWSQQSAQARTADPIRFELTNIFDVQTHQQADCIISSLFTHHLTDIELVRFIQWMAHHSRVGWLINDLHRHPVPYAVIKTVVRSLNMNTMVQHDAPVSVLRGFTRQHWQQLLGQAGTTNAHIQWHWPFRYVVSNIRGQTV
jgi:Methyltransferase domain